MACTVHQPNVNRLGVGYLLFIFFLSLVRLIYMCKPMSIHNDLYMQKPTYFSSFNDQPPHHVYKVWRFSFSPFEIWFLALPSIRNSFHRNWDLRASPILFLFYLYIIFISATLYLFEKQYSLTLLSILSIFLLFYFNFFFLSPRFLPPSSIHRDRKTPSYLGGLRLRTWMILAK